MSIEKVMQDLTDAVKANTLALQEMRSAMSVSYAGGDEVVTKGHSAPASAEKKAKPVPAKTRAAPAPAPVMEEPVQEGATPTETITVDTCTARILAQQKAKGTPRAKEILAQFGVNVVSKLEAKQYPAFVEACDGAME
jgi:hypothetical protein